MLDKGLDKIFNAVSYVFTALERFFEIKNLDRKLFFKTDPELIDQCEHFVLRNTRDILDAVRAMPPEFRSTLRDREANGKTVLSNYINTLWEAGLIDCENTDLIPNSYAQRLFNVCHAKIAKNLSLGLDFDGFEYSPMTHGYQF